MSNGSGLVAKRQRACIEQGLRLADILTMIKVIAIELQLPNQFQATSAHRTSWR